MICVGARLCLLNCRTKIKKKETQRNQTVGHVVAKNKQKTKIASLY